VAPGSQGLFARACVQSPPIFDAAHDPDLPVRWAQALSDRAGGRTGSFELEALLALPAQRVVELDEELLADRAFAGTRGGARPVIEAASLPGAPVQRPDAAPRVDLLVGATADEATFFFRLTRRPEPDAAGLASIVGHLPGIEDAAATISSYRSRAEGVIDNNLLLVRIATDAMIAESTARWAAQRASAGARVYRYRVDHPAPDPDLGATHSVDVPLMFGTYGDGGPGTRLAGDDRRSAEVSGAMMSAWGAFVRGQGPGWAPLAGGEDPVVHVFGGPSSLA